MTTLQGGFKDVNESLITIEIKSKKGTGAYDLNDESSPIKISWDTMEISYELDSLFDPIVKKQMQINLLTNTNISSFMSSSDIEDISVLVKRGDEVIFDGFVEPFTFSQSYFDKLNEYTINCIDYLGILENKVIVDSKAYKTRREDKQLTFKDYLAMILPTNTYWDNSKSVDGISALENLNVNILTFLGDSEDKVKKNDEILESILKYLNLHAIQEGSDVFLFDWNTLKKDTDVVFVNVFDNTKTKTVDLSIKEIRKQDYRGDNQDISVKEYYNKIKLKCNTDDLDTAIENPFESDNIEYYWNKKKLWMSEYIASGDGSTSNNCFKNIVRQGYQHPDYINESWDGWERRDYYYKLCKNPAWQLSFNGKPIQDWISFDNNDKIYNLHRILEVARNYYFFPFMIEISKNEESLNKNKSNRLTNEGTVSGKLSTSNYIVISVNGNEDDSQQEFNNQLNRRDRAINLVKNGNNVVSYTPLLEYNSENEYSFSPADSQTTNYLVFSGKIILNPIMKSTGAFGLFSGIYRASTDKLTFKNVYDLCNMDGLWFLTVDVSQNGDGARYAQQFYTSMYEESNEAQAANTLMFYPYSNEERMQRLEYNYSAHWDDSDKIDKVNILQCVLKIGSKYLVEDFYNNSTGVKKSRLRWIEEDNLPLNEYGQVNKYFYLGFNPAIGDKLIGKEYDITNTVNALISSEKGMAIPIKNTDKLSGRIHFEIIQPIVSKWNEIEREHPTFLRSTHYYDHWKNVLSYVSSIMIKDFEVKTITDSANIDKNKKKKDIIYETDINANSYLTKDDIEFDIFTKPTSQELTDLGIGTNIYTNNCMKANGDTTITMKDKNTNVIERPEKLYISQYYDIYSEPRINFNTTLDNSFSKMKVYKNTEFGNMIPLSVKDNLKYATTEINLLQV